APRHLSLPYDRRTLPEPGRPLGHDEAGPVPLRGAHARGLVPGELGGQLHRRQRGRLLRDLHHRPDLHGGDPLRAGDGRGAHALRAADQADAGPGGLTARSGRNGWAGAALSGAAPVFRRVTGGRKIMTFISRGLAAGLVAALGACSGGGSGDDTGTALSAGYVVPHDSTIPDGLLGASIRRGRALL